MSSVKPAIEQRGSAPAATPVSLPERPTPPSQNPGIERLSITTAFENLELTNLPGDPTPHAVLAHLKLLHAIQTLKIDIGHTDGLFGLWDWMAWRGVIADKKDKKQDASKVSPFSMLALKLRSPQISHVRHTISVLPPSNHARPTIALPPFPPFEEGDNNDGEATAVEMGDIDVTKVRRNVCRIREKRWMLYVARAVERYRKWLWAMKGEHLTTGNMAKESSTWSDDRLRKSREKYSHFPVGKEGDMLQWQGEMMIPIDVLMVWHTHMLNPRAYLEDCIRFGLRGLWLTGMPWKLVDISISNMDFSYHASRSARERWCSLPNMNLRWDSLDDPAYVRVMCLCGQRTRIPWTTCGEAASGGSSAGTSLHAISRQRLDLRGYGFGDAYLGYACEWCRRLLTRDSLSAARFVGNIYHLHASRWPMPGTILSLSAGVPARLDKDQEPRDFPNGLFGNNYAQFAALGKKDATGRGGGHSIRMKDVATVIDRLVRDKEAVKVAAPRFFEQSGWDEEMRRKARMCMRKVMGRHWNNPAPFALDLVGAVSRQGIFIEKMFKIDWLHSPSAEHTASRLILKYKRFMKLMGGCEGGHLCVPTLDVDLAWHTHQLSPRAYYAYTVGNCGRFVDHDDKVPEDKLSEEFAWTTKRYQELFGEAYSECTCWYCEAIQATTEVKTGKFGFFQIVDKKQEGVAETPHTSATRPPAPYRAVHISAHNSVRPAVAKQAATLRRLVHRQWLQRQHAKAVSQVPKRGGRRIAKFAAGGATVLGVGVLATAGVALGGASERSREGNTTGESALMEGGERNMSDPTVGDDELWEFYIDSWGNECNTNPWEHPWEAYTEIHAGCDPGALGGWGSGGDGTGGGNCVAGTCAGSMTGGTCGGTGFGSAGPDGGAGGLGGGCAGCGGGGLGGVGGASGGCGSSGVGGSSGVSGCGGSTGMGGCGGGGSGSGAGAGCASCGGN